MNSAITVEPSADSRIVRVVMNRPPANALDLETVEALHETFRRLARDPATRVISLESALSRIFSAGADVSTVEAHDVDLMDQLGQTFKDLFLHMRHMPQVIVAAVGGHCLGGGLELALATDFRVGKAGAGQVGLPEINLGLFPGGGGVQMVARLVGVQRAYRMALTGALIPIDEAYTWGLFDELVPGEQFASRVAEFLEQVAERPSQAVRALKAAVWRGIEMNLAAAFDFERMMHRGLVATDDAREGARAFREKRAPAFGGQRKAGDVRTRGQES